MTKAHVSFDEILSMKSRTLALVVLLLSSSATSSFGQAEHASAPVAEYVFSGKESFSFGSEDVVSVRNANTTDNSDEHKLLFIELAPTKQAIWEEMTESNAGGELSYKVCGKIIGNVLQHTAMHGPAVMMVALHEAEWVNSVLLGRKQCHKG